NALQVKEPEDEAQSCRVWVAEVRSCVRIESTLLAVFVTLEPDFNNLVRIFDPPHVCDGPTRIGPFRSGFQFIICQRRAEWFDDERWPHKAFIKLVTEDDHAPADADQKNVNTRTNAGPQMNLKERSARPHILRVAPQTSWKRPAHGCLAAYFSSAGVLVAGPMPTICNTQGSSFAPS